MKLYVVTVYSVCGVCAAGYTIGIWSWCRLAEVTVMPSELLFTSQTENRYTDQVL